MPGGLLRGEFSKNTPFFEDIYGNEPVSEVVPLRRDVSNVPLVFQGLENTCVACTITWIRQWMDVNNTDLSHEWLAELSKTTKKGATPEQVLKPAEEIGVVSQVSWDELGGAPDKVENPALRQEASHFRIPGYAYLRDLSLQGIYRALKKGVLAVGLKDYFDMGPHMVAVYDVTDDGTALKAVSWSNPSVPDLTVVPISSVESCIFIGEVPASLGSEPNFSAMLSTLLSKFKSSNLFKAVVGLLLGATAVTGGVAAQKYGASGIASGYQTAVAVATDATQSTLTVSSVSLRSGETLSTSTLRLGEGMPVYLKVNPNGPTEELWECWGLSNLTFDRCGRGIGYLGTGTTSTIAGLAKPHAAGERVILSNDAPFFNRFMDTFTDQSVTGTKSFLSNVLRLGDGATAIQKIYFDNGQALPPYLKVLNGGSNSSFFISQDGVSELELNSGGTAVGASSTKGIFITDGLIGVKASSTGALAFDGSDGSAYVNVSTTASNTGGFLKYTYDAFNQIYWDIVSFLAHDNTWSGVNTFTGDVALSGNTTSTGSLRAQTPTLDQDVAIKSYVDGLAGQLSATGTSAVAITAGQALYITTTSTISITSTSVPTTTFAFIGFAANSVSAGQTVTYTPPGGINCSQSGLTAGSNYYLNGTTGGVALTAGTYVARIGKALSATCIQVLQPYYKTTGTITMSSQTNGTTQSAFVGFYPAKMTFRTIRTTAGEEGVSFGDDGNEAIYQSRSAGTTGGWATRSSAIYFLAGSNSFYGTLARAATTFTITHVLSFGSGSVSGVIQWTAESQ